jgi:hypothetical protein
MSKARIDRQGVWARNVPWQQNGEWRTDIFKSTLADARLRLAKFNLKGGTVIQIQADELRRLVNTLGDHYGAKIWGPFNLNPVAKTLNRQSIQMEVLQ